MPDIKSIWDKGNFNANKWESAVLPAISKTANYWTQVNNKILNQSDSLGNRYFRFHYEDLVNDLEKTMSSVMGFVELEKNQNFSKFIRKMKLSNMNKNTLINSNHNILELIKKISKPVVDKFGYPYF